MTRLIALILLLTLSGCCTLSGKAESAARAGIAIDLGHMQDEGLPQPAREIATDNHDFLWSILYYAGCEDELPADVRARKDAREAARVAAEGDGGS